MLGTILAFAAPLVGEAIGLIGRYISGNAEERAKLEERKQAAMAEMRSAGKAESEAHDTRTAETRRLIAEALASVDGHGRSSGG